MSSAAETYEFAFPESVGGGTVSLREPTTRIEIDAERAARGGGASQYAAELLKRCLVAVDDQPIDWSKADPDLVLDRLGPKRRALLAAAFQKAFNPTMAETAGFLGTMKIKSSSGSPSSS